MKKIVNEVRLSGYVYSHNLEVKTVANKASENFGKPYINGRLDVATDDDCLNVVSVNFTYVTPQTKSKSVNPTYNTLAKIIESGKTVMADGKENATKVNVNTSLALNEFYSNQDGTEQLRSSRRCEGGFVSIVDKFAENRNYFNIDMLMTGFKRVEADPERNINEDYGVIRGAVFNFRGDLLPVNMEIHNVTGINYFENQDLSDKNPMFTRVEGSIVSTDIVYEKVEESAFGEPMVTKSTRSIKEWVIMKSLREPYEYGDAENGISAEDIAKAMEARNLRLADIKKRQAEYQASKSSNTPSVPAAPVKMAAPAVPMGNFSF